MHEKNIELNEGDIAINHEDMKVHGSDAKQTLTLSIITVRAQSILIMVT